MKCRLTYSVYFCTQYLFSPARVQSFAPGRVADWLRSRNVRLYLCVLWSIIKFFPFATLLFNVSPGRCSSPEPFGLYITVKICSCKDSIVLLYCTVYSIGLIIAIKCRKKLGCWHLVGRFDFLICSFLEPAS